MYARRLVMGFINDRGASAGDDGWLDGLPESVGGDERFGGTEENVLGFFRCEAWV